MNKQEILNHLSEFPYHRNDYWIITGGAMVMYGIREQTADIDLGCSKQLADQLETDGFMFKRTDDGKRWFKYGENIEIFEDWLRDTVETVCVFNVVSVQQCHLVQA